MFKVKDKYTNEILTVYHVRNVGNNVMFLFYKDKKWDYDYAGNYDLVEEE